MQEKSVMEKWQICDIQILKKHVRLTNTNVRWETHWIGLS